MKSLFAMGAASAALLVAGAAMADEKITRTLDFEGFDRVDVTGVYDITITVGEGFSITLSGDADEMERVEAYVEDGGLHLDRNKRKKKRGMFERSEHGIDVEITMPALVAFDVSGVADGDITGVDADRFDLDVSGVADVDISGTCKFLNADLSGVGELDAEDFQCKKVKVEVSGVGEATVYASESVDAQVSGMGEITVYGSPSDVTKSKSMFSDITIK